MVTVFSVLSLHAQIPDTAIKPTSLDPKLIEWKNAKIPKNILLLK
jgi:hypothetical protein